ncbi:MAG: DUF2121 domain-containing protein [Methanobrevibacter sp.]|jgi:hypothetical protein|nr:DUF2121 domain-containing protein [Candidatus Methanoflexus mossambicus]
MSLIIAYVGKKGCVMAGDKRRISYFGDKEDINSLEEKLYSGNISTNEELKKIAKSLNVSIQISDNESKLKVLDNAIVAEVSTKSTKVAKRKRVYGTTNGYKIIELEGTEIIKDDEGESAIIVFGNKITKSLANELLKTEFKTNISLKYMGEIFTKILNKIAIKTPSISTEVDVLIKNPKFSKNDASTYLNKLIKMDVKLLTKFRDKLTENIVKTSKEIKLAEKIINEGEVGLVSNVDDKMIFVDLNKNVQAYNTKWELVLKSGENALMMLNDDKDIKIGDKVVIENETLCIKRNKAILNTELILMYV